MPRYSVEVNWNHVRTTHLEIPEVGKAPSAPNETLGNEQPQTEHPVAKPYVKCWDFHGEWILQGISPNSNNPDQTKGN